MEVVNRFAVLSGGEKVRQETLVIGDSIVRLVDDVLCRYKVTVHNDTSPTIPVASVCRCSQRETGYCT